jgi:hypothetical protein
MAAEEAEVMPIYNIENRMKIMVKAGSSWEWKTLGGTTLMMKVNLG